jgi:hypothetical protein
MTMKKILSASLVVFALIGAVSTASATEVPGYGASLTETLHFWDQFTVGNE